MQRPASIRDGQVALDALSVEQTEAQLVQAGADIAQAVTGSRIAYLHFLNDDQNTIELCTWSSDTRGYCTATYDRHYPISSAGIWADSARQRRPCIHNDYLAMQDKRGLPEGHSPLVRHLGVPVIEDGKVRMLVGVGNKDLEYGPADISALENVARRVWSAVRQRRMVERLLDVERRFQQLQEMDSVCAWEYDAGLDCFSFDRIFTRLFAGDGSMEPPTSLEALLARLAPESRPAVREAFERPTPGRRQRLRVEALRVDGGEFPAEMRFEFRPREIGQGLIGFGILQDLSDQVAMVELRRRADTDALTGLPNRHCLHSLFAMACAGGRRARDAIALHYVDLDDFKPVNDTWGHAAGDHVLRVLARRLKRLVRRDDLVARVGGDEFIVVQTTLVDPAGAGVLAGKIIERLSRPVEIQGRWVQVGASVGIAVDTEGRADLATLSARADRALYRAKSSGGRRWCLADEDSPG